MKGEIKMIYTIEKRSVFGGGTIENHYEVRCYERRTAIGALVGGKTLKKAKTKAEAMNYCGRKGILFEEL